MKNTRKATEKEMIAYIEKLTLENENLKQYYSKKAPTQQLNIYVTRKTDIKNALLIIGISLIISGMVLIIETLIGAIPISVGGLMFGYGAGIKQK